MNNAHFTITVEGDKGYSVAGGVVIAVTVLFVTIVLVKKAAAVIMPIGLISLSILLALGAVGLGLMGLRLGRINIDPRVNTSLPVIMLNAGLLVGSLVCWIGSFHFFTKAFGG